MSSAYHGPNVGNVHRSILGSRRMAGAVAQANAQSAPGARLESVQDVALWRDALRARLRAERAALTPEGRAAMAASILPRLRKLTQARFPDGLSGRRIVAYLPMNGEIDLIDWMRDLHAGGATVAVPQTRSRHLPFLFCRWHPGKANRATARYCPGGAADCEEVTAPEMIVVPMLGWDAGGFRLGYGSGMFDRTLSRIPSDALRIGIALQRAHVQSLCPQPFDIRMHHIVTESATHSFPG